MTKRSSSPSLAAVPMDDCAAQLAVLADQTRLDVVRLLLEGPQRVKELNSVLCIEQSLLSHHLKVLRDSGIVEAERDGKSVLYRLAPQMESRRRGRVIDLGCCRLSFDA